MRRPQLIEIEFALLAALSLLLMMWGVGSAVCRMLGLG